MALSPATRKFLEKSKSVFQTTKKKVKENKELITNPKKYLDKKYYGEEAYKKIEPQKKPKIRTKFIKSRYRPSSRRNSKLQISQRRFVIVPSQPQQFSRSTQFIPPAQNMFAKDPNNPNNFEGTMDLLFGHEGEMEVGKQQVIFPQLNTSDVGDIISSVQSEMFAPPMPMRRMPMRRRRRR